MQVVVAARNGTAEHLIHTALTAPGRPRVVVRANDKKTPPGHPAFGKTELDGYAAAYVCKAGVCENPVTTVEDLRKAIEAH